MNLYAVSLICFGFGVVLTAILVLVKRKDSTARRFGFFSISVSGWAAFAALWTSQLYSAEDALFFNRCSHMFAAFIPILWVHFVFEFIDKKEPFKNFYLSNYFLSLFFLLVSHQPYFVAPLAPPIVGFKYFTAAGFLYHFYVIFFYTLIPYAFYYLWRAYRN